MVDIKSRYGPWGLVAGAAEGLGEAFAETLAGQGMDLILVDQQKESLEALSSRLESGYGIQTRIMNLDLASESSHLLLMEAISGTSCRLLIYNAAYSRVRKFIENDPADLDRYVRVNMHVPLLLIHSFCGHHTGKPLERKGLILMSSLAGLWGTRLLVPYGASKAFGHILAESLYFELKGGGFDVLACMAGATGTPGFWSSRPRRDRRIRVLQADRVATASLNALGKKPFVVPGSRNRMVYFLLSRILPRMASVRIMNRAVARMYPDRH